MLHIRPFYRDVPVLLDAAEVGWIGVPSTTYTWQLHR